MKLGVSTIIAVVVGHFRFAASVGHDDFPTWREKYGLQYDLGFSGPLSFSHLSYTKCLEQEDAVFDVAILGVPFDSGVTYRTGFVHLNCLRSVTLMS